MNKTEVIEYLKSDQDARGIAHWEKHAESSSGLRSFGIGLTKLRKFARQPIPVLMAMGTAVIGIGMRSKNLNAAAIKVARKIGPIDFDPDGRCDPMDIAGRLSSDFVRNKLGL